MNKAILIGRLTKDVELRTTQSNNSVSQFTVAVNRPKREDGTQETDFINCIAWNKLADNIAKYCSKGSQVAVEGRIQTRTYETEDGTKRYITEVLVSNIMFLSTKDNADTKANTKQNKDIQVDDKKEDPFAEFGKQVAADEIVLTDDDLPF